jgi:hypothetical protein
LAEAVGEAVPFGLTRHMPTRIAHFIYRFDSTYVCDTRTISIK